MWNAVPVDPERFKIFGHWFCEDIDECVDQRIQIDIKWTQLNVSQTCLFIVHTPPVTSHEWVRHVFSMISEGLALLVRPRWVLLQWVIDVRTSFSCAIQIRSSSTVKTWPYYIYQRRKTQRARFWQYGASLVINLVVLQLQKIRSWKLGHFEWREVTEKMSLKIRTTFPINPAAYCRKKDLAHCSAAFLVIVK